MRAFLPTCFCLAAMAGAWAQTPAPPADSPAPRGQVEQRIEHLRTEDKGARIDELRYGGEPQSITVQPLNSALPAYEIVPHNGARVRPGNERDSAPGNAGQRVWKVLGF
ncbi:MAG: hypothetical protein QM777_05785 [Pseudorhodoferax sp.]